VKAVKCSTPFVALDFSVPANPGGQQPNTFTAVYTAMDEGVWSVACSATDAAGNTGISNLVTFRIDKTAPVADAVITSQTPTSSTVSLSATDPILAPPTGGAGSGVKEILYTLDGGTEQTTTSNPESVTVTGAGSHTIVYRARDNVGNTSAPKRIVVVVDASKPNVSYSGASSRTILSAGGDSDVGPVILPGTASDNIGVTSVSVAIFSAGDSDVGFSRTYAASCPGCGPNATFVNWSLNLSALSPAPPAGVYNTTIIARDQAGNVRRIAGPALTFG
jgi:hypothetical protein